MKPTTPYIHYLIAFGQVKSGNELTYEDYQCQPSNDGSDWLDVERALAVSLGAMHAKADLIAGVIPPLKPATFLQLVVGYGLEEPDDAAEEPDDDTDEG